MIGIALQLQLNFILWLCLCGRYFAMGCHCHYLTMIPYETVYPSTAIGSAVYSVNLNAVCLCRFLRHQMNTYLPYWIIYTMSLYLVLTAVSVYYYYCYRCYNASGIQCSLESLSGLKKKVQKRHILRLNGWVEWQIIRLLSSSQEVI